MKCCTLSLIVCLAACTKAPVDQAAVLRNIESLRTRHDLDRALRLTDRSLAGNPALDEFHGRLVLLKSRILRERQGLESAREFLAASPRMKSDVAEYRVRREQATVEADMGRFADADLHLVNATALASAAGKPEQVAGMEVARSRILLKLSRPEEARQCLDSAKRYADTSGDRSLDAYILQYSGWILVESNRFESALAPLQAAYRIFHDTHKPQLAARVAIPLAWAYYRLGRLEKAQELYEQAEPDIAPAELHLCVGHIGNIFYDRGDLSRAASNYKKAAELAHNQDRDYYSNWLSNLAITLADQAQWKEAASFNTEALAVAKAVPGSIGLPYAMVTAGRIAAGRHDYASAEKQLLEVERLPDAKPAVVLDAHAALARVYAASDRPEDAKRQFETAMQLVDRTRTSLREDEDKLSYLASLIKLHQQYVAFQMARNDVAGAFQVSELSRARVLRDRLNVRGSSLQNHGIADYQRAARESGTAYLVYWVAPEQSFVWVIDGAQFLSFPLPGEARIRALVERHQRTVERGAADPAAATELFDMVVPAAVKAKRFVIVPDGPLYGLNFETLRHGSRYWIEDATVAVAPSLELLLARSGPKPGTPKILLVGDAVQWTPEFPKLINASKEIARIGHQFPPGSETVLAGDRATPAAFTKSEPSKYSYVHFAAHAVANRNSPLDSAIVLSQGRLSVKDVLATPVHAQLVTISACSSAGARTYSGEGLVGLAWAFLQSGAHGVVAGLWDVSDYSSPILMESLYAGLAAGKEPADALRAAKLKLLEPGGKYADPYYWGAFQLYLGGR
jgi:CHAT domain-containing protein